MPPVSLPTTFCCTNVAQLLQVDLRLAERDAVLGHLVRLANDLRGVQQRLGRNAPAVEAHAAELRVLVDQGDLHAVVGGVEGGRVSAGPAADDQQLRFANVGHDWFSVMRTAGRAGRSPLRIVCAVAVIRPRRCSR